MNQKDDKIQNIGQKEQEFFDQVKSISKELAVWCNLNSLIFNISGGSYLKIISSKSTSFIDCISNPKTKLLIV